MNIQKLVEYFGNDSPLNGLAEEYTLRLIDDIKLLDWGPGMEGLVNQTSALVAAATVVLVNMEMNAAMDMAEIQGEEDASGLLEQTIGFSTKLIETRRELLIELAREHTRSELLEMGQSRSASVEQRMN